MGEYAVFEGLSSMFDVYIIETLEKGLWSYEGFSFSFNLSDGTTLGEGGSDSFVC